MLYRILTEDINRRQIEDIVARRFDSFTIYAACGYWNGTKESSLVIEIDTSGAKVRVRLVAEQIKQLNGQDAVLIQSWPIINEMI